MGVGTEIFTEPVAARNTWAHDMRAKLQTISRHESFCQCGKPWASMVRVIMAPTGETRRLGIHSCCCVWVCPVCWARRRYQERAEISFAAGMWLAGGGGLATVTLTVPHAKGEPLAEVLERLDDFASTLRSGAGRVALKGFGVEEVLRATEITSGVNGWHPHQHWLMWLREPWDEPTVAGVREWWEKWRRRHWERKRKEPYYDPNKDPYGPWGNPPSDKPRRDWLPDVQTVEPHNVEPVSNHITKGPSHDTYERWAKAKAEGREDEANYLQQFLSPFELGEAGADGDEEAVDLWREYETATAGMHWLRWPRGGFRDRFGMGPAGKEPALEGAEVARYAATPEAPPSLPPVMGRGFGRSPQPVQPSTPTRGPQ